LDQEVNMTTAVACIGLLGLLLFGLGFAVSTKRGRVSQISGCPPDPADPLHKLIRAHGNTAEYAPMLAVLMLVAGAGDPSTWVLWCMGLATLARYLIAAGLISSSSLDNANPLRFVGALGTYVFGLALCASVLLGR